MHIFKADPSSINFEAEWLSCPVGIFILVDDGLVESIRMEMKKRFDSPESSDGDEPNPIVIQINHVSAFSLMDFGDVDGEDLLRNIKDQFLYIDPLSGDMTYRAYLYGEEEIDAEIDGNLSSLTSCPDDVSMAHLKALYDATPADLRQRMTEDMFAE